MDVGNNAGVERNGVGDLGACILTASASHLGAYRRGNAERQCGWRLPALFRWTDAREGGQAYPEQVVEMDALRCRSQADERLDRFVKRQGGINPCVAR